MAITDRMVSIIVVCYLDEGSIHEMMRRVNETMIGVTPNWEVIYVNDDSPDHAESALIEIARKEPRLTVISHSRNFGAQTAFTTGMYQASGDAVVIMDGDLQDPPELIPEMVTKWLEGYDVVYGIREKRQERFPRNMFYKMFYRLFRRVSYLDIPLDAGEFSLMDRKVVDVINEMPEKDRLIRGLRTWAGFRQIGIPFTRPKRFAGESTQSFLSYVNWAFKSLSSFSYIPLQMIVWISFIFFMFFGCLALYYLIAFIAGRPAPQGYMTMLLLMLLIGSLQIFCIGIIAEYVVRMFMEIKGRPHQVIRLLVNDHREEPRKWLGHKYSPKDPPLRQSEPEDAGAGPES